MGIEKIFVTASVLLIMLTSCEEVIDIDLNDANPAFVVEARIFKDSVCMVRLAETKSYFSTGEQAGIDNAVIGISDGTQTEELIPEGNGYYSGTSITGTEGKTYTLEIQYGGTIYSGISYLPPEPEIISVSYNKSDNQGPLNPFGEMVYTITCQINDDPESDNYYLVKYITSEGKLLERYYLLTEELSNSGSLTYENGIISFSESIFYEGGVVDLQLYSIDRSVYNFFLQLTDVLYWKRRIMPPTPYNPASNISNGALGYFAAWSYDSEIIILE